MLRSQIFTRCDSVSPSFCICKNKRIIPALPSHHIPLQGESSVFISTSNQGRQSETGHLTKAFQAPTALKTAPTMGHPPKSRCPFDSKDMGTLTTPLLSVSNATRKRGLAGNQEMGKHRPLSGPQFFHLYGALS